MKPISRVCFFFFVAIAIAFFAYAGPADARPGDTAATSTAAPAFVVHDFGVTLFPLADENARPTCALQAPRFVYKFYDTDEQLAAATDEVWERLSEILDGEEAVAEGNEDSESETGAAAEPGESAVEEEVVAEEPISEDESGGETEEERPLTREEEVERQKEKDREEEERAIEEKNRERENKRDSRDERARRRRNRNDELRGQERRNRVVVVDPFMTFYALNAERWPAGGVEVDVEIAFPDGRPFYWYPEARAKKTLKWEDLKLKMTAPSNRRLAKVQKLSTGLKYTQHWYETPRKGGALYADTGRTFEKFLFYGGLMIQVPAVDVIKKGDMFYVTSLTGSTLKDVVIVSKKRDEIHYVRIDSLAPGVVDMPIKAGRINLSPEDFANEEVSRWGLSLKKAGLYGEEVDTVLGMMRRDLLEADGTRAIYLATQEVFDNICEIKISPAPAKWVRTSLCAVMIED